MDPMAQQGKECDAELLEETAAARRKDPASASAAERSIRRSAALTSTRPQRVGCACTPRRPGRKAATALTSASPPRRCRACNPWRERKTLRRAPTETASPRASPPPRGRRTGTENYVERKNVNTKELLTVMYKKVGVDKGLAKEVG